MALLNADYYKDLDFEDKVRFYMVMAAIAIMAEADTVAHHAKRVIYSNKVLNGTASVGAYALGVSVNPTIKAHIVAGASYDGDLEFTVNSLFTAYAGGAN